MKKLGILMAVLAIAGLGGNIWAQGFIGTKVINNEGNKYLNSSEAAAFKAQLKYAAQTNRLATLLKGKKGTFSYTIKTEKKESVSYYTGRKAAPKTEVKSASVAAYETIEGRQHTILMLKTDWDKMRKELNLAKLKLDIYNIYSIEEQILKMDGVTYPLAGGESVLQPSQKYYDTETKQEYITITYVVK